MKRCALYARYSTDLQSPTSIQDQLTLCRAYADRQGWQVVATFEDAGLSGFGVEHRPGYQGLLAAATSTPAPFDVVLVEDLSRLTRDLGELLRLYHRLQLRGIDLVGVSDGIVTGRQGSKIQLAVKGLVNELYLDDLRDKTHRGLSGRVARGLSPGGRIFGYRTVPVGSEGPRAAGSAPARIETDPAEAAIVRRIFRDYAAGRSLRQIAHALNAEGVPFPAKDTKRGPARRGWSVSTVYVILRNEKYAGRWVWNKTRFLKDPDTGRRRPVPRPPEEWICQERPELRIVEPALWEAVAQRIGFLAERFECGARRVPGPRARLAYSTFLLAGLARCACGARLIGRTTVRRKGERVVRTGWYVCGFALDKGPAVCPHRTWYRQDCLESALLARFREAMTPAMVETLTRLVNARSAAAQQAQRARAAQLQADIQRVEREVERLIRFLADGGDSEAVRDALRGREATLQALRGEWAALQRASAPVRPEVHPAWVRAQLERLDALLRADPGRARAEIAKHLDGDLVLTPRPAEAGTRRVEIAGRVKADGLLADQEAVSLTVGCGGWI